MITCTHIGMIGRCGRAATAQVTPTDRDEPCPGRRALRAA
jgi:hypothetical protein